MMQGEGKDKRSLEVLPRRISDVHRDLRDVIDTLCVLEDFLLGSQVRDVGSGEDKATPSGVVERCFDHVTATGNSIKECHDQLRHIIEMLGATPEDAPKKL